MTIGLQTIDATLMSKEARRKWEARFTEYYIAPILSVRIFQYNNVGHLRVLIGRPLNHR